MRAQPTPAGALHRGHALGGRHHDRSRRLAPRLPRPALRRLRLRAARGADPPPAALGAPATSRASRSRRSRRSRPSASSRAALPEAEPAVRASVVRRAGGNALFLEELIRYAAEGREELPLTVQALVQARLDRMSPALRQVLRAAAVFGQSLLDRRGRGAPRQARRDRSLGADARRDHHPAERVAHRRAGRVDLPPGAGARRRLRLDPRGGPRGHCTSPRAPGSSRWATSTSASSPATPTPAAISRAPPRSTRAPRARRTPTARSSRRRSSSPSAASPAGRRAASRAQLLIAKAQVSPSSAACTRPIAAAEEAARSCPPGSDLVGRGAAHRRRRRSSRRARAPTGDARAAWALGDPTFSRALRRRMRAALHARARGARPRRSRRPRPARLALADQAVEAARASGALDATLRALDARTLRADARRRPLAARSPPAPRSSRPPRAPATWCSRRAGATTPARC